MSNDRANARRIMVDCQVRTCDVTNHEVLEAFYTVPREEFAPDSQKPFAYLDEAIPLGGGRFLAAPAMLAKLIQVAAISSTDKVLDVGSGTGYSTALIARLCARVTAVETDPALAATATHALERLGVRNAAVEVGKHENGAPGSAPYDVIFIGGAVGELPDALLRQLAEGGRMVAVEGAGHSAFAMLYLKNEGRIASRRLFNCAIAAVPGLEKKPHFVF
jgi:protein-L-isoaspartate(D-aspartate) O-methyltransferase